MKWCKGMVGGTLKIHRVSPTAWLAKVNFHHHVSESCYTDKNMRSCTSCRSTFDLTLVTMIRSYHSVPT